MSLENQYGFEEFDVGDVVDAGVEGDVERVVFAALGSDRGDVSSAREEAAELVERYGHHTVGAVEGLFDPVSMMHIDVDIQYPLMTFQQLEDPQNDVVHIAESRGFRFFRMMQSTYEL